VRNRDIAGWIADASQKQHFIELLEPKLRPPIPTVATNVTVSMAVVQKDSLYDVMLKAERLQCPLLKLEPGMLIMKTRHYLDKVLYNKDDPYDLIATRNIEEVCDKLFPLRERKILQVLPHTHFFISFLRYACENSSVDSKPLQTLDKSGLKGWISQSAYLVSPVYFDQ